MSLYTRVTKIERSLAPGTNDDASFLRWARDQTIDRASQWLGCWLVLRETMTPAHVERVDEVLPDAWGWLHLENSPRPPHLAWHMPYRHPDPLIRHVNTRIHRLLAGKHHGAFALPASVADVVTERTEQAFADDCADCGVELPSGAFTICPLCGGTDVGVLRWYRRHGDGGQLAPIAAIPTEAITAMRPVVAQVFDQILEDERKR